jgi:hypothetical protein
MYAVVIDREDVQLETSVATIFNNYIRDTKALSMDFQTASTKRTGSL